jgi:hypothetical protein
MSRSAREVLEDHLARRARNDVEGDLQNNYSPNVILLCEHGTFEGHDAIRKSADQLARQVPDAKHEILQQFSQADYGLIIWRASGRDARAEHGVDSFVIRDGRIVMQSIYYEVKLS